MAGHQRRRSRCAQIRVATHANRKDRMAESIHLSLVLPVLNGADRLASALPSVATWMQQQPSRTELVLVDDGSGSETAALLQRFASDTPKVTVLVNGRNRGKGHAVARGML